MVRLWISLLAGTALIAGPAQAQQLAFGARAGMTRSSSTVEGDLVAGSTTGYHVGMVGTVGISSWFGIQTELIYARKGFEDDDIGAELELTYFEVPVLTRLTLPTPLSPHLLAGVVLSLESGCTFRSDTVDEVDCEVGGSEVPSTKGADFGLEIGGGVALDLGRGDLTLDILYNHGLTDLSQTGGVLDNFKNRTLYFSVGYLYPLGAINY